MNNNAAIRELLDKYFEGDTSLKEETPCGSSLAGTLPTPP